MTAADWFLIFLILCVVAGVAATGALVVIRRGNRQIDEALAQILDMRREEETRRHLRIVRAHELEATLQRARRRQNGGTS